MICRLRRNAGDHDAVTKLDREIEDALASKTEEKREAALWRITDLFIAGSDTYTEDHVTLFDDVIGRLAATIETNARAKLSNRLARVPNAPVGVVRSLATTMTSQLPSRCCAIRPGLTTTT